MRGSQPTVMQRVVCRKLGNNFQRVHSSLRVLHDLEKVSTLAERFHPSEVLSNIRYHGSNKRLQDDQCFFTTLAVVSAMWMLPADAMEQVALA